MVDCPRVTFGVNRQRIGGEQGFQRWPGRFAVGKTHPGTIDGAGLALGAVLSVVVCVASVPLWFRRPSAIGTRTIIAPSKSIFACASSLL